MRQDVYELICGIAVAAAFMLFVSIHAFSIGYVHCRD